MLAEVALFTLFVVAGVLSRRRPEIHRAMMLLASLSILAGATVRMPILFPVFGESGWMGIFGPIFALGAGFLLARTLLRRVIDRWLAPAITVTRMTEEDDVVVAEGSVRTQRRDGRLLNLAFCDVFEIQDGKIRRLINYLMEHGEHFAR